MKRLLLTIICFFIAFYAKAQDVIIFTNGDEVEAKVSEVSDSEVKYKLWNNQNGPTWVKKTGEIFMIRYENGTKQTFTTNRQDQSTQSQTQEVQIWHPEPSSTRKVTLPATVLFGGNVSFGYNWAELSDDIDDYHLHRWPFSFGIHFDYFGSKSLNVNSDSVYEESYGIGFDIAYTNRGGQCHLIDREYNIDWIYQVEMSFLSLRLMPLNQRFGKNNSDRIRFGLGVNVLMKSYMRLDQAVYEDYNFAWKPISPCFYMEMYHKFGALTLGIYGDISMSLYEKGSLGFENMSMFNFSVGLSMGLETK